MEKIVGIYESRAIPRGAQTLASRSGVKLPDNKDDSSRMMYCLPRGSGAGETAKSSRVIGVCCAATIFHALDHWSPGECEGARQAKVGENATGGLQHMGALRPDLPIEAMIKIKMVAVESEVMGPRQAAIYARPQQVMRGKQ